MEAGPRDTAHEDREQPPRLNPEVPGAPTDPDTFASTDPADAFVPADPADDRPVPGGVVADGPDEVEGPDGGRPPAGGAEVEVELRPRRLLRIWQLAPIVAFAAMGSLMFAFPLAFQFGDGGAVVAMLGLLLGCCSAGWAVMAVRRVGHAWPGLPRPGSGRRADWRVVAAYVILVAALVVLAVLRVARLR